MLCTQKQTLLLQNTRILNPLLIQKDIAWRLVKEMEANVLAVNWLALDDLISTLYKDFNNVDKGAAIESFRERKLI